ncbi:MAG: alanine racemase [Streptococcaceae bacterium]|nr:alanine racemase [Streptococcaceae bacterium]
MESIHRPTRVIVSPQAIKNNIEKELAHIPKGMEVFAVIKANAYGHGAIPVANIAANFGVSGFGVATLDEAIQLREAGITLPILVLASVSVEYLHLLQSYHLSATIATMEWWEKAQRYMAILPDKTPVQLHIKVDTGMGRLGFGTLDETKEILEAIEQTPGFAVEGIFTHFATADDPDFTYYDEQKAKFEYILANLPKKPRYIHMSNTASSIWHDDTTGNMVRFGIGIYGLNPSGRAMNDELGLIPAMRLESRIIQCKQVPKDTKIGYGATYSASESEWIGTVPIGYADGWTRRMQGFKVLVNGKRCEIVGRVCMDQMMIRLPEFVAEGTKVTLIGKDGDDEITMQEIAEYMGTINYEVACLISDRVPRIYE